jgi:outer membrane lipoprotein-sorting protein
MRMNRKNNEQNLSFPRVSIGNPHRVNHKWSPSLRWTPLVCIMLILIGFIQFSFAQYPSGKKLLEDIDKNLSSKNRVVVSKMVVHGQRGSRTIESKSWSIGDEKAFTEYLAPAREKGTKMLKVEDDLWLYSPDTDRTIKISGHMLRQSVMGSDLSYEDMMDDKKLSEAYDAAVTAEDTLDGRECWMVDLTGKEKDLAYHFRKLWVDKSRTIPLKEELIAKSGKLLKKIEFKDVEKLSGRWFPKKMIFKDMLKTGKGTEFIVDSIEFDVDIPAYKFTKASLRK